MEIILSILFDIQEWSEYDIWLFSYVICVFDYYLFC